MQQSPNSGKGGVWDEAEHELFLECLEKVPADCKNRWKSISKIIRTRTSTQVRTHAQKFFKKLRLQEERKVREQQQLNHLRQQAQMFMQNSHQQPEMGFFNAPTYSPEMIVQKPRKREPVEEDTWAQPPTGAAASTTYEKRYRRASSSLMGETSSLSIPSLMRSQSENVHSIRRQDVGRQNTQFTDVEISWLVESLVDVQPVKHDAIHISI